MDLALNKVKQTVIEFNMISPNDRVLVGLSGGADSVFLLLNLICLQKEINFEVFAAHLNHGIRGTEADADEEFVKTICTKHGVKLFSKKVNIPQISAEQKISEECAGRNERYLFFNEICQENNINKIAVAHNKNDSVETVLLNLIRGSSLNGLCGIKPINDNIIRPIIDVTRDEIEKHLNTINQDYCIDSTNSYNVYTRNKIRNVILKEISKINPSVIDTIYSNLKQLNNDKDFLENYCNNLNCIRAVNGEIIIDKGIFDKQHIAIKSRIVMDAFYKTKGNCNNITNKHVEIICNANKTSNIYHMPDNITVKISHHYIIFSENSHKDDSFNIKLLPENEYCLNNGYKLSLNYVKQCNFNNKNALYVDADLINNNSLTARSKIDGDKFIPYGKKTPKKLKQYFNDIKVPSYNRNQIPIITNNDEIVAVLPYRISDNYKITDSTTNILEIKLTKEEDNNGI